MCDHYNLNPLICVLDSLLLENVEIATCHGNEILSYWTTPHLYRCSIPSITGIEVHQLAEKDNVMWPWHPPALVTDLYLRWCDKADPLLCANPPYFRTMEVFQV